MREQDYLARRGYVVLHTDYRGHAGSDDDPRADMQLRLGYTEDVINAVLAVSGRRCPTWTGSGSACSAGRWAAASLLQRAGRPARAGRRRGRVRAGQLGHRRQLRPLDPAATPSAGRSPTIIAAHGSPEENPEFWRDVSPRTFFDRVTEPVLIHHGTSDDSCPIRWSRDHAAALRARPGGRADADVRRGGSTRSGRSGRCSMRRTVAVLRPQADRLRSDRRTRYERESRVRGRERHP